MNNGSGSTGIIKSCGKYNARKVHIDCYFARDICRIMWKSGWRFNFSTSRASQKTVQMCQSWKMSKYFTAAAKWQALNQQWNETRASIANCRYSEHRQDTRPQFNKIMKRNERVRKIWKMLSPTPTQSQATASCNWHCVVRSNRCDARRTKTMSNDFRTEAIRCGS